ncbi:hypothetical protein AQUCO_01000537v1 [Aquilegia coerulea]|uniref:mannan endo-1,4-beta-mannosidase n=1 Tax=Aquilegia coerulea TaxID=218851 RepID=A0A2G5EAF1_AQUCA|nr:hypothetical protein AQUCO_01000537v1 [Aquilegia coerulea]
MLFWNYKTILCISGEPSQTISEREMKHWCVVFFVLLLIQQEGFLHKVEARDGFIRTRGLQFMLNGSPYYANGFNAYWLMYVASDPSQRNKISSAFQEASRHGLTVARTWAFSDAGYRPLQYSPGSYNEDMFKGLDFVISEARKYGIKLILSFVNNYENLGGKKQYVDWARNQGQYLSSEDDFFRNPVVRGYYKNHVKAWISEMASYVKSIDRNHLLEAGLEGFYGEASPQRKQVNPGLQVGTDFITNNQIADIDFATVHSYPDQWLSKSDDQAQMSFLNNWLDTHIEDAQNVVRKPLLLAEFGKSSKDPGFNTYQRDMMFKTVYSRIESSAKSGGATAGGLFWQLLTEGMDSFRDGYEIILGESPSTAGLIAEQSRKLYSVRKMYARLRNIEKWKRARAIRRAQWFAFRRAQWVARNKGGAIGN